MAQYGWEFSRARERRRDMPPAPGAWRRSRRPPPGEPPAERLDYGREYEFGGERYEPWWGGGPGYTGGYGYEYRGRRYRASGGRRYGYRRGEPPWRSGRRRLRSAEEYRTQPETAWMGDEAWASFTGYGAEYEEPDYRREYRRRTRHFRPVDYRTEYDERAFAGPEYVERYGPPERYGHTPPDRWPGTGRDLDRLPPAERRMSDDEIRENVLANLDEDNWIDPSQIDVTVEDGVVTLSGEVDDFMQARYAWDDAWESAGVRGVINNLTVRTDVPRREMELPQTAGSRRREGGSRSRER
ncbi:MAG TPA: BON domain-containing protein [Longimicrobiales bacterium]